MLFPAILAAVVSLFCAALMEAQRLDAILHYHNPIPKRDIVGYTLIVFAVVFALLGGL